jgi:hypothetical protein
MEVGGGGGRENREQDWPVRALDSEMSMGSWWKPLGLKGVNIPGHEEISRLSHILMEARLVPVCWHGRRSTLVGTIALE